MLRTCTMQSDESEFCDWKQLCCWSYVMSPAVRLHRIMKFYLPTVILNINLYDLKSLYSDLHSVWWSGRHVVDQFAVRLSETCRTDLLSSEGPARPHFVHTSLCLQCEFCRTVCESTRPDWGDDPAARSPALWSLKVETSVLWWTLTY